MYRVIVGLTGKITARAGEKELAYSPLNCVIFATTTNVTSITKKNNKCDYNEQKQTYNALRYRVDLKTEGLKN